ncbi:lysophospholipase [Cerioporus squamosus]|nr:lysophospholipase [Cerioporus squamosus]
MASSSTSEPFKERWIPGPDGIEFYTRTYAASSPRAIVVFVHGISGHCARYEWMHGVYASRGITVFAFDQRGFGRTALDAEAKTGQSLYGKTSWREQLSDIDWWVKHVKDQYPALPVFLMGHSMGGALALAFATRVSEPPSKGYHLTSFWGYRIYLVLPNLIVHTPINPNNLSRDPVRNQANADDPRIIHKGSLRILNDMLSGGEELLWNDYKSWPKNLPLISLHGTSDRVTSFSASEEFSGKIHASDKTFRPFLGGFHELAYEPDGVKERFVDECTDWIFERARYLDGTETAIPEDAAGP